MARWSTVSISMAWREALEQRHEPRHCGASTGEIGMSGGLFVNALIRNGTSRVS